MLRALDMIKCVQYRHSVHGVATHNEQPQTEQPAHIKMSKRWREREGETSSSLENRLGRRYFDEL